MFNVCCVQCGAFARTSDAVVHVYDCPSPATAGQKREVRPPGRMVPIAEAREKVLRLLAADLLFRSYGERAKELAHLLDAAGLR